MSTEDKRAYPLQWPIGWQRTAVRKASAFSERSPSAAAKELKAELERLKARSVVISTNVTFGNESPRDPGVCVYFVAFSGRPYAIPCDKFLKIEDNLWAIAKHLEGMRSSERWGVGSLERAFAGYMALMSGSERKTWREVFGIDPQDTKFTGPAAEATIRLKFKQFAFERHPDHGGSNQKMAELNVALEEALAEINP